MAVDTPARVAIVGAGPIGLETALYARFLGYDVDVYERGRVCEHLRGWGHVRFVTPFAWNASPLGIAALRAQDPAWTPPDADDYLTGEEFLERYLLPLAASDLIEDNLRLQTEVLSIAKTDSLKAELVGQEERGDEDFRLLVRGPDGQETCSEAAIVIDCSGMWTLPNAIGPAGLPAIGELALAARIERGVPNLQRDRARFADKHTLVIGAGPIAARNVEALLKLAERHPGTRITWMTREPRSEAGPIALIPNDPLPERDRRTRAANAAAVTGRVQWLAGASAREVAASGTDAPITVHTLGEQEQAVEQTVDHILADVGFRPDTSISRELQVRHCPATEAIETSRSLVTGEPNFYVLGAKSYGRRPGLLLLDGLKQIRDLFKIIGDREALDLYQSIGGVLLESLPPPA